MLLCVGRRDFKLGRTTARSVPLILCTLTLVFVALQQTSSDETTISPQRVYQGSVEEEKDVFVDRDLEMFRSVFDWLENVTTVCSNVSLMGGNNQTTTNQQPPGAKWICLDSLTSKKTNSCLVMSMGAYDGLSLEISLAEHGCEVHVLDPHQPHIYRKLPESLHYYPVRVSRHGSVDGSNATLDTIFKKLADSQPIQLLQMDVDGTEAEMLIQQLFDNTDGQLAIHLAQQIALSVHISSDLKHYESLLSFDVYEESFKRLSAMGYRVASSVCVGERRWLYPGVDRPVCGKYNILMLKSGHDTWDRLERGNVPMRLEYMSRRFG